MQVQVANSNHKQAFGMNLIQMGELKGKDLSKLKELIDEIRPLNQNICIDSFHMNGSSVSKAKHSYGFTLATGTDETNKIFLNSNKKMTIDTVLKQTNELGQTAFDSIVKTAQKLGKRMELEEQITAREKEKAFSKIEEQINALKNSLEQLKKQ